jgi:2-dehydropantoate 2-reductase
MCHDIANKTHTEIDYLGGKVVEYGRTHNVATPVFNTMANLVKTREDSYLSK